MSRSETIRFRANPDEAELLNRIARHLSSQSPAWRTPVSRSEAIREALVAAAVILNVPVPHSRQATAAIAEWSERLVRRALETEAQS